jgi:lysophospholipase L1-like esterase
MKHLLLSALLFSVPAFAEPVALDLDIGGRVAAVVVKDESFRLFSDARDTVSYTYQWPGVYFEGRFAGDSVDVKVDDDQNNLYVWVDGVHKLTLTKPGRTTVALENLGAGAHVVRLEKSSETQSTTGKFEGFYVPSQADALPPLRHDRRIEFIGDSYTVGYGDTSRGQTCTVDDVAETTDTSRAFAPAVAKHFDAAYRINAFSGRGIVRNYNGIVPGEPLPVMYRYTLFDKSVQANDDGWTPDAIVIGLGTNDFSTPLNPGEKWASREDLRADYINSYTVFINSLHEKWPSAHIILMASTANGNEIADGMTAAAGRARSDGIADLETIVFSGLDWQACHGHPSLKDHVMLSRMLIDRISVLPKFR